MGRWVVGWRASEVAAGCLLLWAASFMAACGGGGGGATGPVDGGTGGDGAIAIGDGGPAASIDTVLDRATIQAGDAVPVRCVLADAQGNVIESGTGPDFHITDQPESLFGQNAQGQTIGLYPGTAEVRCTDPAAGLVDDSPAAITVEPGPPAQVITQLDKDVATAGDPVQATCLAFDAFGNAVTGVQATVTASPSGSGVAISGTTLTVTRAGTYDVSCQVMGAMYTQSASLEVLPGAPATLSVALDPAKPVYVVDDFVTLATLVQDAYGNDVLDAPITYSSSGSPGTAPMLVDSQGDFVTAAEGTYTLSASVDGTSLSDSAGLIVNSAGPAIDCVSPADESMQTANPGSNVQFEVRASDAGFSVAGVTIDGTSATQNANGNWVSTVPVQFGMNFVDVTATDGAPVGPQQNSRTCVFLASPSYIGKNAVLPGGVSLRLDQNAVDDMADPSALDSLNDLLATALDSAGIKSVIGQALTNAGSLASQSCLLDTAHVYYTGGLDWTSSSSSLTLTSGGLQAHLQLNGVTGNVKVQGCCSTTGSISVSSLSADVSLAVSLSGGVPSVTVTSSSVTASSLGTSFGGVCGAIVDALVSILNGTVTSALESGLNDAVQQQIAPLLNSALGSLDISSLGSSFALPRLDGGTLQLGFNVALNSLDVTSTRMLFGIGTSFSTMETIATPTLGVPVRQTSGLLDPTGTSASQPVAVAIDEGVLNQVLHTLWRGGYFQATISGSTLGLPGGQATIDAHLPPVAEVSGNQVTLMLGAVHAGVTIPGIFDTPLQVTFGAITTASVQLQNGDLVFSLPTSMPPQLFVSVDQSINQTTRAQLEAFLGKVINNVLSSAVNDGLPAIPIPSFTLPSSLSTYGLPAGASLGITNPTLTVEGQHYVLLGGFGVQ